MSEEKSYKIWYDGNIETIEQFEIRMRLIELEKIEKSFGKIITNLDIKIN